MLFVLRLAAFYLAFSIKTACIQHQNTLRFAPKWLAFCTKMHFIQHQNAVHLAANRTITGADGCLFKYKFILLHAQANPFLHQNKPSRESIFCGKVGDWWTERALRMLNFLLKTRQKRLCCLHVHKQRQGKQVRLLPPARAVCRACYSRPMGTKPWKCRSEMALTASFRAQRKPGLTFAQQLF